MKFGILKKYKKLWSTKGRTQMHKGRRKRREKSIFSLRSNGWEMLEKVEISLEIGSLREEARETEKLCID